jgi:hypothetical protein
VVDESFADCLFEWVMAAGMSVSLRSRASIPFE